MSDIKVTVDQLCLLDLGRKRNEIFPTWSREENEKVVLRIEEALLSIHLCSKPRHPAEQRWHRGDRLTFLLVLL